MSKRCIAAPRLAAIDCGVLPPRAGGAAIAAREQRPPVGVDGASGEAKMPFEIFILQEDRHQTGTAVGAMEAEAQAVSPSGAGVGRQGTAAPG
jgi:hypothetical protein